MMAVLVVAIAVAVPFEHRGGGGAPAERRRAAGGRRLVGRQHERQGGRFGIADSALWAAVTTGTSNGAVNGGHDAWTGGAGGGAARPDDDRGGAPGGVGSGIYGMLLFVVVAVFIAGLMVGRTPEYLGKKIGAREIKLTMIGVLVMPIGLLVMLAVVVTRTPARPRSSTPGHRASREAFYAYTSQWNNNGSAFAGYGVTELSATLGGVAMGLGRFVPILAVLALAGALSTAGGAVQRRHAADTTPTFVVTLIFVIMLVAALNFLPALALGPIAAELSGSPF